MEWLSKILTAVVMISILRKSWVVGELTIIRGPMYSKSKWYNRQARELNCASEDDSSALVWNQNLKWEYTAYTAKTPTKFEESSAESSTLDCPLNDEQGCNRQWSISSNWSIVKSINKAMGPVMDRRWEGFNEIECRGDEPWKYVTGVDEKGRIHFSIRGTYDAYLYLCSSENPSNICLWILIGGWQGKQSAIYISAQQGYTPLTFRQHRESVLSSTEWRTFTIKWNEEGRTVSVHDDKQQLLASNITKKIRIDQLYVQSYDVALFRFHLYDYLYANKQGETLQSPEIRVDDSNFCIEMLIGLCAECTMDVVMTDRRRYEYNMGTINSKQTTNEDELPMWQHIRLKTRGNIGLRNIVRVNVITILKQTDRNPFWAFSNVRVCKEDYAVRKSRLIVAQDWTYERKYFWPEVSCQKLSYHGGMLVKSTSVISSNLKHDMPSCPPGKVGPHCAFDCKSINGSEHCYYIAVCIDEQCTCAQGWTGENCDTRCNYGTFGYNCGNRCGNCREGSCDGITGTCSTEADCVGNFLPPYCQIKVEVPLLPSVLRVTETSAHVSLDVGQYRHPDVRYSIYIQQGTGARTDCMNINDGIGRDSTVVQSLCNNLKPGTWYEVYGVAEFGKIPKRISGQRGHFTTYCKPPPPVRELEIYETNSEEGTVLLRWMPPNRPYHGELETYMLASCTKSSCRNHIKIPVTESCRLWENYVCYTVQDATGLTKIKVWAKNKNVRRDRNISTVNIPVKIKVSEAPEPLNVTTLENGVVTLEWSHPRTTYSKLKNFVLKVEESSSNLRRNSSQKERKSTQQYWVHEYQKKYSKQLYLRPSTTYDIYGAANTSAGVGSWTYFQVLTPSALNLTNDITKHDLASDHMIAINLPSVVNETIHTIMYVIVQGAITCEARTPVNDALKSLIKRNNSESAWIAASFPTADKKWQNFTIGNNETHEGVHNCPLIPGQTYDVFVAVRDDINGTENMPIKSNTIKIQLSGGWVQDYQHWLYGITIIAVVVLLTCCAYRILSNKRTVSSNSPRYVDMMVLTQPPMSPEYADVFPYQPNGTTSNLKPTELMSNSDSTKMIYDTTRVSAEYEYVYLAKVKEFENYVKKAVANGLLKHQYTTLPKGQMKSWNYGKLPQNMEKNRYGDLIAYDQTRVILKKIPGVPYSDYINASYIKGQNRKKAYIATQGTQPHTVIDFWRMVWQEDVHIICLLSHVVEDGKIACEQYWPEVGSKMSYGEIIVQNIGHKIFADYTFRTLHITHNQETRKIEHLHYTAWPNHKSLNYAHSVVSYVKQLLALSTGNVPVVVQSSAGIGRAGIIILCDICLRRAAAQGIIDVFAELKTIRKRRVNMVNSYEQYLMAHIVIAECLEAEQTAIPCNEALTTNIHRMKQHLVTQQKRLHNSAWQDEYLHSTVPQRPLTTWDSEKNKYPDIAPDTHKEVSLERRTVPKRGSDDICAVYVDGVKLKNQNVAAQLPLPSTFSDFWRMIAELKAELIIILQPPDPEDSTCCEIVIGEEFHPLPLLRITAKNLSHGECFKTQNLQLNDTSEEPTRTQPVTILWYEGWSPERGVNPPSPDSLVALWEASEKIPRKGPTVAVCHDGITGCGLYLALAFLLERMSVDGECDICSAIRAVRRSRKEFVQSLEQMKFLYDAAAKYAENFSMYANFR